MIQTIVLVVNIILGITFFLKGSYPWNLVIVWVISVVWWMGLIFEKGKFDYSQVAVDLFISFLLFTIAFVLRVYKLGELPFGLWGDEALVANLSQGLNLNGKYLPFIADNVPSHLFHLFGYISMNIFYLFHLSSFIFGKTIFSTRLPSALLGALSAGIFYLAIRERFDRFVSISGSLLFAFSYWGLVYSRIAFEHTLYIFCVILAIWGIEKLILQRKNSVFIMTLGLGLGLTSYTAFRVLFFGFFLFLVLLLARERKKYWDKLKTTFLGVCFFNMPYICFVVRYPSIYWEHAGDLSVLNIPVPIRTKVYEIAINLVANICLVLGTIGDPNPRHNPAQIPMINPVITLLFLTGAFLLWKKDKLTAFLLSILLVFSILPAVLSFEGLGGVNQPHAGRSISALPIIYFFAVFTINLVYRKLLELLREAEAKKAIIFILCIVAILDVSFYFGQKRTKALAQGYEVSYTQAAKLGKKYLDRNYSVFFPPELAKRSQIDFFIEKKRYKVWSGDIQDLEKKSVLITDLYLDQDLIKKEIFDKQRIWPVTPLYLDTEYSGKPDIMVFKID